MLRVAVAGVSGRMGKVIVEAVHETEGLALAAASVRPQSSSLGLSVGQICNIPDITVLTVSDFSTCLDDFDVLIDFTSPTTTLEHLAICVSANKKLVIGTTGFSDEQKQQISQASESIAIVFAPNMSVGVNLCFKLIEQAAKIVGDEFDVEIIEAHHRLKKDAPSGTALKMGEIVAQATGRDLNECAVYGREGNIGERQSKTIGFETIRAGDIVGDHTVMFAAAGERIEITHKSSSRMTYATGSVRAALWLTNKDKGNFNMQDVLGLN